MHKLNTETRKTTLYAVVITTVVAIAITCLVMTGITGAQAAAQPLQASNPSIPQGCTTAWSVVPSPNMGASDNYLYSVTAISANDVWAVGAYTGTGKFQTLTQHWDGTQWSIVPSPNPGGYDNILRGVSGSASNNVWAVGDYSNDSYYSTRHLLTLYWDGANWAEVPNPDPGGNYTNWLNAVDTRAASDAWAVGFYRRYSPLSLVTHFNGAIWSDPNLTGVPGSYLYGIKAIAANDVWAVGRDSFNNHALILHYDGTTWTQVPSAGADIGITLYGVDAASSTDVWTVGGTIEHWNGTAWSTVAAPNAGTLRGVTVISSNDVWAVGDTAFLHWDSTSWSSVAQPATGALVAIDSTATDDVWSVGSQTVGGVQKTLIEHYTSSCPTNTPTITPTTPPTATATPCTQSWSVVSSPNNGSGDNRLYSMAVISASDIWAVGAYTGMGSTLTEHWDGTQWSIVPSPNPASAYNHIRGISAVSSNDVWAVGDYTTNPAGGVSYIFALHWNGTQWSEIDTPDPEPSGAGYWLAAVKAFATNDVWAVGYGRQSSWHSILLHWNGSTWSSDISSPSYYIRLQGIDGVTSNDLWAVGDDAYGTGQHIEHWNGSTWSLVTNPNIGPLNGVAAVSANDVWAVGNTVEHWDGSAWTVSTAPNVGVVHAIKVIATNDVWAAGDTAFLHWDGTSWSTVTGPTSGTLLSLDASAANDVWAVGSQLVGGVSRTLIEHYSSACSTPIPTVTTTPTATSVPTATGTATPTGTHTNTPTVTSTAQPSATTNPSVTALPSSTANPSATTPANTATPATTSTAATSATVTSTITSTITATPTACAISFSDVAEGSTFYPYVLCLVCHGIVQGYPDGTYRPNAPVTRGQAAKIISSSAGWSDAIPPEQQTFVDVPPDSTFWLYAERTYQHGAIGGYPCGSSGEPCPGIYFRPSNTLTRGQIAKIDAISAGYNDTIPPTQQTFSDVALNSTFWLYVEQVALHSAINGYTDGTYRPQNPVTRGQIAKIASNTFFPDCAARNRQ